MISTAQQQRALAEFETAAAKAIHAAMLAERELENYSSLLAPAYSPAARDNLFGAFQEADYQAESLAWIADLIRHAIDAK